MLRGAVVLMLLGCASPPPPETPAHETPDAGEVVEAPVETAMPATPAPPPAGPPSTASYEEALSKPEALDAQDGRAHLTDQQLSGPMRQVMGQCSVPKKAKVVIRVAVQNGRAIGVTVDLAVDKPRGTRPPQSNAAAKAEAKAKHKVVTCLDQAVRALSWPPSPRRDSFTTQF